VGAKVQNQSRHVSIGSVLELEVKAISEKWIE